MVCFTFLQLMEGEKNTQALRSELRDQEELVHRMITLESENNALSTELGQVGLSKIHVIFFFSF